MEEHKCRLKPEDEKIIFDNGYWKIGEINKITYCPRCGENLYKEQVEHVIHNCTSCGNNTFEVHISITSPKRTRLICSSCKQPINKLDIELNPEIMVKTLTGRCLEHQKERLKEYQKELKIEKTL